MTSLLCPHDDPGLLLWSALHVGSMHGRSVVVSSRVLLDQSPIGVLADVTIQAGGELVFGQADGLLLRAERIRVRGQLTIGSEDCQRTSAATIELHGARDASGGDAAWGSKFLLVEGGGTLELHGALAGPSWARLAATVHPGSYTVDLDADLGSSSSSSSSSAWKAGDEIVLAMTDWHGAGHPNEAEQHTIAARTGARRLTLTAPARYRHYAGASGQWDDWVRGEVGLLSRPIRVQGSDDAAAHADGFGGHSLFLAGSTVHVAGVQFLRMGQAGLDARYPFHWHHASSVAGSYLRTSAIVSSYNRCVVVHRTHRCATLIPRHCD